MNESQENGSSDIKVTTEKRPYEELEGETSETPPEKKPKLEENPTENLQQENLSTTNTTKNTEEDDKISGTLVSKNNIQNLTNPEISTTQKQQDENQNSTSNDEIVKLTQNEKAEIMNSLAEEQNN